MARMLGAVLGLALLLAVADAPRSLLAAAGAPGAAGKAPMLQAACSEPPVDDAFVLFTVTEPPGGAFGQVTGPAPFDVAIRIEQGVLVFPAGLVTSTIRWGDGASAAIAAAPCGVEEFEFVAQTHRHTYSSPGNYEVTWEFQIPGFPISFPILFVSATESQPTAVPDTPTPTATPETPTSTPPPGVTPEAPTPTPPVAERPSATPGQADGTASPSPAASVTPAVTGTPSATASPSPSPTPQPTGTATATPAATAAPGAAAGGAVPPPDDGDVELLPGEPEMAQWIPGPEDVSTDPGVVMTNVVIAGVTIWVLFSSAFLDQVLSDRRELIEKRFATPGRWLRRLKAGARGGVTIRRSRSFLEIGAVLLLTGAIYSWLEPNFGWNKATAVVLVSAVLGVGCVTFVCDGLEAFASRRWAQTPAGVRAYPAALAIAGVSVLLSRVLHLTPGVMYGFVASAVALSPSKLSAPQEGRLASVPLFAGLALTVAAWVALGPVRALESSSFLALVAEAALVVVFVGGVEALAISLIPVSVTDGGKVFRWNRWLWLGFVAVAAFLVWHILLGREREYFDGLREASSMTVVLVFVAYTIFTGGVWLWARRQSAEG